MSDRAKLRRVLENLPMGAWQFYPVVGSTNDLALALAKEGAPDWSMVLADAQTAGRGRAGRGWVTNPGSALALSLILRPKPKERDHIPRFTALAALGLIQALAKLGMHARLKWPNDVLLDSRKVAGVLVEVDWQDDQPLALVVGMGVNVTPESVPEADQLRYPATSVVDIHGTPIDRWELLGKILSEMMRLRENLPSQDFVLAWNNALAFRGDWVPFRAPGEEVQQVRILGLGARGELIHETRQGGKKEALAGEILMVYN